MYPCFYRLLTDNIYENEGEIWAISRYNAFNLSGVTNYVDQIKKLKTFLFFKQQSNKSQSNEYYYDYSSLGCVVLIWYNCGLYSIIDKIN